jgi:uncharacterized repeat protein (TIGR03847 family)
VSSSFEFPDLDALAPGAVGPPGQRIFYLQLRHATTVVSLRLEKEQVAALADYLDGMLADLTAPDPGPEPGPLDLVEPVVAEWVIGSLAVAYDDAADRVVVVAEELVRPDEEEPATDEPATARLQVTRAQANAFVERARVLVAAGRPPCRLCGRPLDPEGHMCPKTNGHRRPR